MKDKEPQLWDNMDDEDNASSLFMWRAITTVVTLLIGIFIGIFLFEKPNKGSAILPSESTTSMYQDDPGNFVILENNTTSITFNGFEGELVWYKSHEGNHFHPMGFAAIENRKPIRVPEKAHAFLKRGKSIGETYSMDVSSDMY